jgi:hypothetical protein
MFYLNVNIIDSSTLPQKLVVKTKKYISNLFTGL